MERGLGEKRRKMIERLRTFDIEVNLSTQGDDDIAIGELKNGKIILNTTSRDLLSQIFTIAHLFGHYCQFQEYAKYKHLVEIVDRPLPLVLDDDFKQEFWSYEKEAFGIGLALMELCFEVTAVFKRYYQIFMDTDFEHFWQYITTGINGGPADFNKKLKNNYKSVAGGEFSIPWIAVPSFVPGQTNEAHVTIF